MKILVMTDTQVDFVTGSLGTKEAQNIIPTLYDLATEAKSKGYTIIWTRDTHHNNYLRTQEGKFLPITHTQKDSEGWQIVPELRPLSSHDRIIDKPTFGSLNLMTVLKQLETDRNETIEEIIFVGLCTGICVISNGILTKANFPETPVTIYENACACVTPKTHKAALITAANCQISIKTYEKGGL